MARGRGCGHDLIVCFQVQLKYQDELEQQKIDAKNAVEEYVYDMREKVRDYIIHTVQNEW